MHANGRSLAWTYLKPGAIQERDFVCHGRPAGLHAQVRLVRCHLNPPDRHNNSVHAGCSCGCLGASTWRTFFSRLHVCNFHPGILQCVVENVLIKLLTDLRGSSGVFHFSKPFFNHFFFSFTLVIKRFRELRGESAFGDRSASSMSKCSLA